MHYIPLMIFRDFFICYIWDSMRFVLHVCIYSRASSVEAVSHHGYWRQGWPHSLWISANWTFRKILSWNAVNKNYVCLSEWIFSCLKQSFNTQQSTNLQLSQWWTNALKHIRHQTSQIYLAISSDNNCDDIAAKLSHHFILPTTETRVATWPWPQYLCGATSLIINSL